MKEKIEKLKAVATKMEVAELVVLSNANTRTLQTYNETPTAACKKDWDVAAEGLRQLIARLWQKYFTNEKVYKNRKALLEELNATGYRISAGKLSQDSHRLPSDGGLRVEKDGTIRRSSVEAWLAHPKGGGKISARKGLADETDREEMDGLQAEKLRREVSILRTRDEREKLAYEREQGKWLPRDDFQMELAGRAGVLDVRLAYHFNMMADKLIELVGGDQEHRGALIQELVSIKNQALAEFCSTGTYQVMMMGEDEDQEAEQKAAAAIN